MRPPKIIFRADASPTIGYGHLTRSLALAQMVAPSFETLFATRITTAYQQAEIEAICSDLWKLPTDDSLHYRDFISRLQGDDIVVLDNYYFTTDYQRQIRNTGCKLVCIDDLHDKHYVAEAVINDNIGQQPEDFSKESYTQLYLGREYSLLRSPFLEQMQHPISSRAIAPTHLNILLCFGGSDPNHLTLQYSQQLVQLPHLSSLHVIVGDGYEDNTRLYNSKIIYHSSLSAIEMSLLFREVDIAILPTSTITKEALACGTRVIGGYFVDNQINNYQTLKQTNHIIGIGDLNCSSSIDRLYQGLSDGSLLEQTSKSRDQDSINVADNILQIFTRLIS